MTKPFVKGRDFIKALAVAGVIDGDLDTQRVTIDAEANGLVRLYIERVASSAVLDVLPVIHDGVQIRHADTTQEKLLKRAMDLLGAAWVFEQEALRREMSPEWTQAALRLLSDYEHRDEMRD